ncbi:hypothetical protein N6H18_06070 [Reichenbachiella agarivorans]|uniref:YcxB-like protein n=1 Tax=Reichenbachiella agarivorans TaxID=2979464 RepID=A0ABY6CVM0_9BACT|nr:hypothetical protein [Reichenbachiella agarivorans]UXP33518.1 hypothetical protein N6H18_06070 [Reichenbachiella agarivorans]
MNEFLDKHGYRIYQGDSFVMIRHHSRNVGCVHAIFVSVILALVLISFFLFFFTGSYTIAIITILTTVTYLFELDRRRKQVPMLFLDYQQRKFEIKKGKKQESYLFDQVLNVVATSEHIGGYASSHRSSTEEYKREINVLFKDGFVLTAFSFISDFEKPEREVNALVSWLERSTRVSLARV